MKPAGTIPFADIIITTIFNCVYIFVPFWRGIKETLAEAQNKHFNWLNIHLGKGWTYYLSLRFFKIVLKEDFSTISNDEWEFAVEPDSEPYSFDMDYHSYALRPRWDVAHIVNNTIVISYSVEINEKKESSLVIY